MKMIMHKQQGSALLEGLIAILIFSLGILSLVALLGASVKNTSDAKYRTDASLLANEVIAQMWTDDKALIGDYATGQPKFNTWKTRVEAALPGASTAANAPTVTIGNGNRVTVTVKWQPPGESSAHTYMTVAQINP